MRRVLAGMLGGVALAGMACASDGIASKEEVISAVSGAMTAMAVSQGAKNCFYEASMMLSGYDFKDKPELLKQVIAEKNITGNHRDLMLKGLSLNRASDPAVRRYFEECLSEAEDRALSAAK